MELKTVQSYFTGISDIFTLGVSACKAHMTQHHTGTTEVIYKQQQ